MGRVDGLLPASLIEAVEPGQLAWMKDAALLFFFGVFVVVLIRLLMGGRTKYEKRSLIPLTDDVVEPRDEA